MAVKKSVGIAEGRSFTTGTLYDGACKILKDFLVTTVGWNLLYDDTADGTYPSFYISNKATLAWHDSTQVIYRIGYIVADGGKIKIQTYFGVNATSDAFGLNTNVAKVTTYDSAEFELQIRSDEALTFVSIVTRTGSTYSTVHFDELDTTESTLGNPDFIDTTLGFVRDGGFNYRAYVEVTDATLYTVGQSLLYIDAGPTYPTALTVSVTSTDTVSTPDRVYIEQVDQVAFPTDGDIGAYLGPIVYKFHGTYWHYIDISSCATPPFCMTDDGSAWTVGDYNYFRNSYLEEEDIYGHTIPTAVSSPFSYCNVDRASGFTGGYNYIPGKPSSLKGAGLQGTPLSSGLVIGATNYICVNDNWNALSLYVEDGTA